MEAILTDPQVWMAIATVIAGIFGICQQAGKKRHQKVIESVVLGVEQFSELEVTKKEVKKLKSAIKQKALEYGVETILHEAVKGLTTAEPKSSSK